MPLSDQPILHGQKHEAHPQPEHPSGWQALEQVLAQTLLTAEGAPQPSLIALLRVDLLHSAPALRDADWQTVSSLGRHALQQLHAALPKGTRSFSLSPTQLALVIPPSVL